MVGICAFLAILLLIVRHFLSKKLIFTKNEDIERAMALSEVIFFMSLYCSISISFSVFNKFFYSQIYEIGFPFPYFCTMMHTFIQILFSRTWISCTDTEVPPLPLMTTLCVVAPVGLTSAMDIALSNYSFETISVSAYTIIKSSTVVYVYLFGMVLGLEKFDVWVFASVVCMVSGYGISMVSFEETNSLGLIACCLAAALGALRWTLVHYLVQHDAPCRNPISVLHRISPYAFLSMVPMFSAVESKAFIEYIPKIDTSSQMVLAGLVCLGGAMGVALVVLEIRILQITSALTFSVIGCGKELFQVTLAFIFLPDVATPLKVLGVVVSLFSIGVYHVIKAPKEITGRSKNATLAPPGDSGYMQVARHELEDAFDADLSAIELAVEDESWPRDT